jgi:hypothetical protein
MGIVILHLDPTSDGTFKNPEVEVVPPPCDDQGTTFVRAFQYTAMERRGSKINCNHQQQLPTTTRIKTKSFETCRRWSLSLSLSLL